MHKYNKTTDNNWPQSLLVVGRTCQCPTYVTEKIGVPQAGRRLDDCSSCAKCSTGGGVV